MSPEKQAPEIPPGQVNVTWTKGYKPWLACATENTRPDLAGVFVDPKGYLVSSDGFMLTVIPCNIEGATRDWPGAIVPASAFEKADRWATRGYTEVTVTIDTEARAAIVPDEDGETRIFLIPGPYPEWRTIIPRRQNMGGAVKQVAVNLNLARAVSEAVRGRVTGGVQIIPGKSPGPHLFIGQDGAFGLLMPVYMNPPEAKTLNAIFRLRPKAPTPAEKAE